jgi:hypothetical protein
MWLCARMSSPDRPDSLRYSASTSPNPRPIRRPGAFPDGAEQSYQSPCCIAPGPLLERPITRFKCVHCGYFFAEVSLEATDMLVEPPSPHAELIVSPHRRNALAHSSPRIHLPSSTPFAEYESKFCFSRISKEVFSQRY